MDKKLEQIFRENGFAQNITNHGHYFGKYGTLNKKLKKGTFGKNIRLILERERCINTMACIDKIIVVVFALYEK